MILDSHQPYPDNNEDPDESAYPLQ
jgi:hypothetical protein